MTEGSSVFSRPARPAPMTALEEAPERAMVVFAHPDDAEIGAGGAVAAWSARGCEITYVLCTTGSSGSNDHGMSSDRIVPIRSAEQQEAATILGVRNVVMLDHPDGGLEDTYEFRGELVRALRIYRPHTVFCHDPHRMKGFQHRDHRMVGIVTMDAIYPYARDHLHFPEHIEKEGLQPHKVKQLLMWGADEPDVIVDVTESLEKQIEALKRHESQVGGLSGGRDVGGRLRERASKAAIDQPFAFGETFRRLIARD